MLRRLQDEPPPALLTFYESYRACVRAKVAALRAGQAAADAAKAAREEAADYVRVAARHAHQFAMPLLVAVGGLMGTGKSTLSAAVAETLGCDILQTDALRRELFGVSPAPHGFNQGTYARQTASVSTKSCFLAMRLLAQCETVLLDGTFLSAALLRRVAAVAAAANAPFLAVRCTCPEGVARQRVAVRMAAGGTLSEARPELLDRQLAESEDMPVELPHVMVDTTLPLEVQVHELMVRLRAIMPTL